MSITNHSKTMLKMSTNHSVGMITMSNTINPNEIIKKKGIKINHINHNPSKDNNLNKIIDNSKNNQTPSNKGVSRRSIVKIECKSKNMLLIS